MNNVFCPKCKSLDIKKMQYVNTSIYGHLPNKGPFDICNSCGFKSKDSFSYINFRDNRDNKIEEILKNKDGI